MHPQKYALPYTYGATSEPEMITKPEWTPAGVCILGWSRSRSQYFRFEPEPESTLRSVQEPIEIFKIFLYTVDCTAGLVTGFDHDAGSNVQ